jgi:hypothetical protein
VAAIYQFQHLGRFASVYRKKFGESPSQTMQNKTTPTKTK